MIVAVKLAVEVTDPKGTVGTAEMVVIRGDHQCGKEGHSTTNEKNHGPGR